MIHKRAIIKALKQARIKYSDSNKTIFICCPFHKEHVGSLAIYTTSSPPNWYCFGCSKHGIWDSLSEVLNLGKLDRDWDDPQAFKHLSEEIKSLISIDPILPPNVRPWSYGKWRNFSSLTLSKARSLWWWDDLNRTRRIVWPVWDPTSYLLGWVGRALDDCEKRYFNMSHMRVGQTLWPWPTQLKYPEKTLVLVEGITDALRLLQVGIPALALLGTVWNKTRSALVSSLDVEKVVLALDPDEAGLNAADKIAWNLQDLIGKDHLFRWDWPVGHDAGDAPEEEVENLRRKITNKETPVTLHPWLMTTPTIQENWHG